MFQASAEAVIGLLAEEGWVINQSGVISKTSLWMSFQSVAIRWRVWGALQYSKKKHQMKKHQDAARWDHTRLVGSPHPPHSWAARPGLVLFLLRSDGQLTGSVTWLHDAERTFGSKSRPSLPFHSNEPTNSM